MNAAPPLPEPVSDETLINNSIESFGDHPAGHPDMWRYWYRLIGRHHPRAAANWLFAWSFVRWADNLLDQAETKQDQARILAWGMGRLRALMQEGAPENVREQCLQRFLDRAEKEQVELFFRITAAAEHEKSQIEGAPTQAELERIIEYNAVLPVLLHCQLIFEGQGIPAEQARAFGRSFGQVTRYADVFVDLEEDLEAGIIPVSREACARLGFAPVDAALPEHRRAIRNDLRDEYRVHRARAQTTLERLGVDRRTRFSYGTVLQAFDRCVYGLRATPGQLLHLLRFADQTVFLLGFVLRSIAVSWAERRKTQTS